MALVGNSIRSPHARLVAIRPDGRLNLEWSAEVVGAGPVASCALAAPGTRVIHHGREIEFELEHWCLGVFPVGQPYNVLLDYWPTGEAKRAYVNVTRPAEINGSEIAWTDLYVDVIIEAGGDSSIVDLDELRDAVACGSLSQLEADHAEATARWLCRTNYELLRLAPLDQTLAALGLRSTGTVPCGANDADSMLGETIDEIGGLALGLTLADNFARSVERVRVPAWESVPLGDRASDVGAAALERLGPAVIKWSGANESFSSGASRGLRSSRGRRVDSYESLRAALATLPTEHRAARSIVLQQLVDVDAGALTHAEVSHGHGELELRRGGARVLACGGACGFEIERRGPGSDHLAGDEEVERLLDLHRYLASLAPKAWSSWNIEGLVDESGDLVILQVRPTPNDRPQRLIPELPVFGEPAPTAITRFVWGVFDVCVKDGLVTDDSDRELDLVVRRGPVPDLEPAGQVALDEGGALLLLDVWSGFRLSHEPWNLPLPGRADRYFGVGVPSGIVEELDHGAELRCRSDGEVCTLWINSGRA